VLPWQIVNSAAVSFQEFGTMIIRREILNGIDRLRDFFWGRSQSHESA
jgi:hypothetical protein